MGMLRLLKASLWGTDVATVTRKDFEEMKIHAIATLPAGVLSQANLDAELRGLIAVTADLDQFKTLRSSLNEADFKK